MPAPVSPFDLVFAQTPATSGALVFGADDSTGIPLNELTLSAALPQPLLGAVITIGTITDLTLAGALPQPALSVSVGLRYVSNATLVGVLAQPVLSGTITAEYLTNTARPTVDNVRGHWQVADHGVVGVKGVHQASAPAPAGVQGRWQLAAGLSERSAAAFWNADRLRESTGIRHQTGVRSMFGTSDVYSDAVRDVRKLLTSAFQNAEHAQTQVTRMLHQDGLRDRRLLTRAHWTPADPCVFGTASGQGRAKGLIKGFAPHHQNAMRPPAGIYTPPVTPGVDPCYVPSAHLLFDARWSTDANLVFVCERHGPPTPGATVVLPIRRAYIVLNNITLHRVDTGVELSAHSFSMSLDYQSWTWSWSASLHHDAAAHLGRDSQGDPAELAVVVNGVQFRLRLERIGRDRRFNPTRWAVSGRGKAAVLDAPYAPSLSFGSASDRTAQQLMADALTINGVGIGWSVDWGLTDWLVPGGAWALQGPYIAAINDIAAAAGGYVQPHPTDAVLRILPRYPAAPWNWGSITPDFEIPADAAEVEGTEYVDRPGYNRVFVGGVGAGVFGPFTRAGTAGNAIAPQITHPLITHADAHRQRGLAELSDTGRQEHIMLKMQVLPETGVITPGQFVRYLGDKTVIGIVRSTSIDWSRPVLRQTIGIETHA